MIFFPRLARVLACATLMSGVSSAFGQEVITAERFFERVSGKYATIRDYEAEIRISQGESVMEGLLSFKAPSLMRIDFDRPENQVIVSDGEVLWIYYPVLEVVFEQDLGRGSSDTLGAVSSSQSLQFLESNYAIAYVVGPDPVLLEDGSDEYVVKLILTSRSSAEGFRQIEIAVDQNSLIRRMSGVSVDFAEHVFDFVNIRINQNIPETRFEYELPSYANVYKDFLFEREE